MKNLILAVFLIGSLIGESGLSKPCTQNEVSSIGAPPHVYRGRIRRIVPVVRKGDSNPKPILGYVVVSGDTCGAAYFNKSDSAVFDDPGSSNQDEGLPCSDHSVNLKIADIVTRANKRFEGWEPKGSAILNFAHFNKRWVPNTGGMVCDSLVDRDNSACPANCRKSYEANPSFYCEKTLPFLLSVTPNSPCKPCCDTSQVSKPSKPGEKAEKKKEFKFKDLFSKSNSLAPTQEEQLDGSASPRPSGAPVKADEIDTNPRSLRPMRKLKAALKKYESLVEKSDFETAAKYIPEPLLKKWGGPAGYKKMMLEVSKEASVSQGVDLTKMKSHRPAAIEEGGKLWVSVIPTEFPIKKGEVTGFLFASILAISDSNGMQWSFLEVGKDSRAYLTERDPKVLKKIKVSKRRMMTEKNKVRTYQVQNEGKWVKVGEKEFFQDLPQRKGIFHEIGNWFMKKKATQ